MLCGNPVRLFNHSKERNLKCKKASKKHLPRDAARVKPDCSDNFCMCFHGLCKCCVCCAPILYFPSFKQCCCVLTFSEQNNEVLI